jgi:hypothetical protein
MTKFEQAVILLKELGIECSALNIIALSIAMPSPKEYINSEILWYEFMGAF